MSWQKLRKFIIQAVKRVMPNLPIGETYWGNRYVITRMSDGEFRVEDTLLKATFYVRRCENRWHVEEEDVV